MTKKNKILRYTGIAVLLVGIILNVLMFAGGGWPTYLYFVLCGIGLLLLILSYGLKKISNFLQIIITAFPFLLGYIYFEINAASNDIFLIPQNYRGQVLIIYGQENGQPKEYENGWRVYRIPQDGTLKTQFKLKGESINLSGSKYYFVDDNGNRKQIKTYCDFCEDRDTTSVQIIFGSLGSSSSGTTFQDFFIATPNSKFSGLSDNRFDKIK